MMSKNGLLQMRGLSRLVAALVTCVGCAPTGLQFVGETIGSDKPTRQRASDSLTSIAALVIPAPFALTERQSVGDGTSTAKRRCKETNWRRRTLTSA